MGLNRYNPENIDPMTGVYTKECFFAKAAKMINDNPDMQFCIVELDVNRLTMVNDMFGLSEGDRLLKCMAKILSEVIDDDYSLIARIHADLFAFLCPYSDKAVEKIIKDIQKGISNIGLAINFDLLISFGVYVVDDKQLNVIDMCGRANIALKTVKGNYVKNVAYFDKKMHEKMCVEMEILSRMNASLHNKEFEVYFQPKHNLDDESLIGAEALVRWNTKDGLCFSPGQFIPIFEANGFIMELDKYVWEQTCIFISSMQSQGIKVPPISVNISKVDLFNPELVNVLVGLLRKYAIDPRMLKLEFTESSYAENEQLMLNVMEQLHIHGLLVEMDDFGSGYSSLNMLKDVPIDGLKIDVRFLSSTKYEKKSKRILTAVIHMSKWLGIPCIVEGVETEEQLRLLKGLGCTMVQGFYFARPMKQSDFVSYMERYKNLPGKATETFSELVMEPYEWWEGIIGDCEPVLEMSEGYMLIHKSQGYMLEPVMGSDSCYDILESNRQEVYDQLFNIFDYVHEEDRYKLKKAFDDITDYHSIGKCICRLHIKDRIKSLYVRIRLLEKNDDQGIYFCIIDDISKL